MAKNDLAAVWLLLLAQLPASPSSARVALWRRLRAAGATSVMQGAWVLPRTKAHQSLLSKEVVSVRESGGSAALFECSAVAGTGSTELKERFRSDRVREYHEFAERSGALLAEIAKETRAKKFTFAELEEIEDDLAKLKIWLGKIATRDFFPDKRRKEADAMLIRCEVALRAFAENVYLAEGALSTKSPGTVSGKGTKRPR